MITCIFFFIKIYTTLIIIIGTILFFSKIFQKKFWKKENKYSIYWYFLSLKNENFFLTKKKDSLTIDILDVIFTLLQAKFLNKKEFLVKLILTFILYNISCLYTIVYILIFLFKIIVFLFFYLNKIKFLKKNYILFKIKYNIKLYINNNLIMLYIYNIHIHTTVLLYKTINFFFIKNNNVLTREDAYNYIFSCIKYLYIAIIAGKPLWIIENFIFINDYIYNNIFLVLYNKKIFIWHKLIYWQLSELFIIFYKNMYFFPIYENNITLPMNKVFHECIKYYTPALLSCKPGVIKYEFIDHQTFNFSVQDDFTLVLSLTSQNTPITKKVIGTIHGSNFTQGFKNFNVENILLHESYLDVKINATLIGRKINGNEQYGILSLKEHSVYSNLKKTYITKNVLQSNINSYNHFQVDPAEVAGFLFKSYMGSMLAICPSISTNTIAYNLIQGKAVLIESSHYVNTITPIDVMTSALGYTIKIDDACKIKNELYQKMVLYTNEQAARIVKDFDTNLFNELLNKSKEYSQNYNDNETIY